MTNGNSKFNIEALKTLGLIIGLLIIIAQGLMSAAAGEAETGQGAGRPARGVRHVPSARCPKRSPG